MKDKRIIGLILGAILLIGVFGYAAYWVNLKKEIERKEGERAAKEFEEKMRQSKDENPNYKPGYDIPRPPLYISTTAKKKENEQEK